MTDQPGTAGQTGGKRRTFALPIALAAILIAEFVFFRPDGGTSPAPALAQVAGVPAARAQAGKGPSFPALSGRVIDAAGVIPADAKARLETKLAALETQSKHQLVVATVPDLQGYEIADYAYQLGRAWGIGSKDNNDGVILLVAPTERKVWITTGYGMEGTITDGLSSLIVQQQIVPRFKAGDLPGGIEAGADALIAQMQLPPDQAAQVAAQANAQQAATQTAARSHFDPGAIIWFAFIFLFFVLPMLRRMRGGRRYRSGGLGNIILWNALNSMSRGGGSGGGGWSSGGGSDWGGGGGGFSGGGGSFGGGGAGGSW
jgi:uncharacterized protein